MATIRRLKVSSRVLLMGTCGDSLEARTVIAGLVKGTLLCTEESSRKTPFTALNHPASCSVPKLNENGGTGLSAALKNVATKQRRCGFVARSAQF
jgi:hypothetical protein